MSYKVQEPGKARVLEQLLKAAGRDPDGVALRHKHRGVWIVWSWRDVVAAVDRYASALSRYGLEPGSAVALAGEISPNLVIAALAARVAGAPLLSIAPQAKASAIREALASGAHGVVRVAIVQGRTALAEWLDATASSDRPIQIVFDHITPDGRPPNSSVRLIADLRNQAPANGWAERLEAASKAAPVEPILWVEATTAWADGLDAVIDSWIGSGEALALPELLAASVRDRQEIRPNRWIASAERVAAAYAEIASRLPLDRGIAGRIVARAPRSKESSESLVASLLTALLRQRLGLSRLRFIEVGGTRELPTHYEPIERMFAALGAPLRRTALEAHGVEARNFVVTGSLARLALSGDAR
jgi:hypothetical protein